MNWDTTYTSRSWTLGTWSPNIESGYSLLVFAIVPILTLERLNYQRARARASGRSFIRKMDLRRLSHLTHGAHLGKSRRSIRLPSTCGTIYNAMRTSIEKREMDSVSAWSELMTWPVLCLPGISKTDPKSLSAKGKDPRGALLQESAPASWALTDGGSTGFGSPFPTPKPTSSLATLSLCRS